MKIILIFALLFEACLCADAVYVHTNISDFQCFKDKLYAIAFVRGYLSTGKIDPYLISNLKGASILEYRPYVYMNPCLKCKMSLVEQVNTLMDTIVDMKYDSVIFKVKLSDHWPNDPASNCKNIKLALNEIKKTEKIYTVQSDINDWNLIMGKDCKVSSDYRNDLFWDKHDKQKNFKGFKPFAGYNIAITKEYDGPLQVCNHEVDVGVSYYNFNNSPFR